MSKISKNIKMLEILSSGKKYTCKELSELLEISPRVVRLYKDELEKEGIYIESIMGKNGGYKLYSQIELPSILFNEYDIKVINEIISHLKSNNDIEKLNNLKDKITNYCKLVTNEDENIPEDKKKILNIMKEAISLQKSVKIEYFSKGVLKQRIVYPKQIYKYNDLVMIVVKYSEDNNDIRHLNLNKIEKVIN